LNTAKLYRFWHFGEFREGFERKNLGKLVPAENLANKICEDLKESCAKPKTAKVAK
jgi:hypothetical protein